MRGERLQDGSREERARRGEQNLPTAAQSAEAYGVRVWRGKDHPVRTPPDPQPRRSIRLDATLNTRTRAKLEDLATQFSRSRAAVLRQVMRWGLGQAGPIATRVPKHITSFFFMVDAALHQQVREAAKAAGIDVAPWLRHMMRQIRMEDFPQSWQARTRDRQTPTGQRSHDSRQYGKRFMLRLDEQTWARLEELAKYFGQSDAEVIRQLIVQANLADFPQSWHLTVEERQQEEPER
jgi:predicted DNA-binding protein